jgi:hypothetical protein
MSEKIYTRLLRLYPSRFRKEYEGEALQLIRDRFRDETGFVKRTRLFWDLAADFFLGFPQACRNSYAATEAASLSRNAEGIPSFKLLDEEPIGRGSILLGGSLSLATIVTFGFLLSRSMAQLPVPQSNGRLSPIEAVVERLNRATTPDSPFDGPEEDSGPTSVGASERQPRPWPAAGESPSQSHPPALLPESTNAAGGQKRTASIPKQIPNEQSVALAAQLPSGEPSAWRATLTDAFNHPVRAAEIHVIGGHGELVARTAADGGFSFSELIPGDYEVTVVINGREVAYLKALHLSAISSPSRLTLASGGRLLITRPGYHPIRSPGVSELAR